MLRKLDENLVSPRAPERVTAVGGFFGWIYYATPIELWAYATGNP